MDDGDDDDDGQVQALSTFFLCYRLPISVSRCGSRLGLARVRFELLQGFVSVNFQLCQSPGLCGYVGLRLDKLAHALASEKLSR